MWEIILTVFGGSLITFLFVLHFGTQKQLEAYRAQVQHYKQLLDEKVENIDGQIDEHYEYLLERIYKYTNEAVEKGFSAKHSKSYDELVDNVCDSLILKGYAIEESEENLKKMRSPEEPRLEL